MDTEDSDITINTTNTAATRVADADQVQKMPDSRSRQIIPTKKLKVGSWSVLGHTKRKQRLLISGTTIELLGKKPPLLSGPKEPLRNARKLVKQSARSDREKYWSQMAFDMQQAAESHNLRKIFKLLREDALDMLTRPEQVGFGPRGGCQKHCLTLHLILQQSERFQLSDMIAFIDFVPAFDSLIRTELVKIVLEDGAPAGLIEIFKGAYESTVTKVRATEGEITEFYVDSGFKQWCALLPARFNYIKDCILAYRLCNHKGLVIGQRRDTLIDFDFDDLK
ncbi:hypothetical protein QYM36_000920 [Artemia franciscana]|uniref:Reverse transcriptase domain-containing protein n=1 Tax=Artemia franciscana TaxID=6661 RepID=A0AA88IM05_ARTSF|nr:hypothetical protein QYM36_000920 [Artemia franciscana]